MSEDLAHLTHAILDRTRPAYSLRNEILELKAIFETAGGFSAGPNQDIAVGETVSDCGVAISPTMAAMCLDDFARTVQFIRGINDAIADLRHRIDDRAVRVLYAGCGPWAPLAIPLMSILDPDAARFTLLDIHEESIHSVTAITRTLGFTDRVDSFEIADASQYRITPSEPPDLIIIEMLRAALEAEPQVAVARHLNRQAPNATIIPQEVRIDLALVNRSREHSNTLSDRERIFLETVFRLDRDYLESDETNSVTVRIPDFDEAKYAPMLLTTVRVYGDHVLRDHDSGVTLPRKIRIGSGEAVEFVYETGRDPRLVARRSR